jgi:hypothetical protein
VALRCSEGRAPEVSQKCLLKFLSPCHDQVGSGEGWAIWYTSFKIRQLGEQRYNALMVRAHQTGKKDEVLARLYVRGLIRELEKERGIRIL